MADLSKIDFGGITPDDSPKTAPEVLSEPVTRDLMTAKLGVGDVAHDFALPLHDFTTGVGGETGARLRLADASATRPVALIFGSYT